ncbi:hypothetical protein BJ508DRAFT_53425 [Ascobolus immersus RN42]|uniref:Myb-like domain-containing protein n=1 Tax=Ascobolus immersus RN42 TaxID=1160509 RepID=A0A3N4HIY7_ASCIM|nr:hypothetical protein BJ508DRAFT_53425 [Ascobolus immersus RN42]
MEDVVVCLECNGLGFSGEGSVALHYGIQVDVALEIVAAKLGFSVTGTLLRARKHCPLFEENFQINKPRMMASFYSHFAKLRLGWNNDEIASKALPQALGASGEENAAKDNEVEPSSSQVQGNELQESSYSVESQSRDIERELSSHYQGDTFSNDITMTDANERFEREIASSGSSPAQAEVVDNHQKRDTSSPVQSKVRIPALQKDVPWTNLAPDVPAVPTKAKQKSTSSYWNIQETIDFPPLLMAYGTDWASIAEQLSMKSAVMVMRYYMRQVDTYHPEWRDIASQADTRRSDPANHNPCQQPHQVESPLASHMESEDISESATDSCAISYPRDSSLSVAEAFQSNPELDILLNRISSDIETWGRLEKIICHDRKQVTDEGQSQLLAFIVACREAYIPLHRELRGASVLPDHTKRGDSIRTNQSVNRGE